MARGRRVALVPDPGRAPGHGARPVDPRARGLRANGTPASSSSGATGAIAFSGAEPEVSGHWKKAAKFPEACLGDGRRPLTSGRSPFYDNPELGQGRGSFISEGRAN